MSDDLLSKMPIEDLKHLIDYLNNYKQSREAKPAQCADPIHHQEIVSDLIDHTQFKGQMEHGLYRELYRLLESSRARPPKATKQLIEKMLPKFTLKERPLYLDGKPTSCMHMCLYNRKKDTLIPSKEEVRTIFDLAHHSAGHSWNFLKEKLKEMRFYTSSSSQLYRALCNKCQECKTLDTGQKAKEDVTSHKRKKPGRPTRSKLKKGSSKSESRDPDEHKEKPQSDLYVELPALVADMMAGKGNGNGKKVVQEEEKTRSPERKEQIQENQQQQKEEAKSKRQKTDQKGDQYPVKGILSDSEDRSWIVPLLHLFCTVPEIAYSLVSKNEGLDLVNVSSFVREYWKGEGECLAEFTNLRDYVKRINRNETDYKDFWQTVLALALPIPSEDTALKSQPTSLGELMIGETVRRLDCWEHPVKDDVRAFLYLPLRISEDTNLVSEMIKTLFSEPATCKIRSADPSSHEKCRMKRLFSSPPQLLVAVIDRSDLSASIELPFSFPMDTFCTVSASGTTYQLCNLVCCCMHEERVPHFFSYVLNPVSGTWYCVHEAEVRPVEGSEIDFSHAFFAVYRKVGQDVGRIVDALKQGKTKTSN